MGKLLKIIIVGAALKLASSRFNVAATDVANNFKYIVNKPSKKDIRITLRDGKLVGVIKLGVSIKNENPISVYLNAYRANLKRNDRLVGSINTTTKIELPSNETRTITAEFVLSGENIISELEAILEGGSLLSPIIIDGQIELSTGLVLPISQKLEFLKVS